MAKKIRRAAKHPARRRKRRDWTKQQIQELRAHSRAKTAVAVISKQTKRTPGALRTFVGRDVAQYLLAHVLGVPAARKLFD